MIFDLETISGCMWCLMTTDLLQLPVFQLLRLTESVIFWEEMQNKTIHSSNVSPHRYPPLFAAVFERVWSYFHNMVKGVVIFWEALQNKTFQSSGVSWRHFLHKRFVASITRLFACSGVQHILCCAFCLVCLLLMCPMWSVSLNYSILDCSFGFL
jgi:hypothetical protein